MIAQQIKEIAVLRWWKFFSFTIKDSIKVLMQIVRLKPDLVLLDVNMAGIDGYELSSITKSLTFQENTYCYGDGKYMNYR